MRTLFRTLVHVLAFILAAFLLVQLWFFAHIVMWRYTNPGETAFMSERLAELRKADSAAKLRRVWIPYARISPHLKRAMIAAEDARFVDHEGFDWDGIQLALAKNERRHRIVAGGSTITQQTAKNLFLSAQKSYLRKGEEALITLMLEATLDKERIFEIYLNVIEWGNGLFGAEAAAQRYFGVSAAALSPEQAAKLAAMAPNPRFYERHLNAPGLARKTGIILARMRAADVP